MDDFDPFNEASKYPLDVRRIVNEVIEEMDWENQFPGDDDLDKLAESYDYLANLSEEVFDQMEDILAADVFKQDEVLQGLENVVTDEEPVVNTDHTYASLEISDEQLVSTVDTIESHDAVNAVIRSSPLRPVKPHSVKAGRHKKGQSIARELGRPVRKIKKEPSASDICRMKHAEEVAQDALSLAGLERLYKDSIEAVGGKGLQALYVENSMDVKSKFHRVCREYHRKNFRKLKIEMTADEYIEWLETDLRECKSIKANSSQLRKDRKKEQDKKASEKKRRMVKAEEELVKDKIDKLEQIFRSEGVVVTVCRNDIYDTSSRTDRLLSGVQVLEAVNSGYAVQG
ncbi:hypothetical protein HDE_00742 [Halotydeus destructor]|nr:hypothetical protein HDE_00742 [Halotydeus destructor]